MKNECINNEVWKARFDVQRYLDLMWTSSIQDSDTTQQKDIKILVGMAAIFNFQIFSIDATQANIQNIEKFNWEVYIKPPAKLGLTSNQSVKLIKPFYF